MTPAAPSFPGAAISVVADGVIASEAASGYANLERRLEAHPDTPFAIGSISKQFAAASILLLVQSGRLSLDERLDTFVPMLPNAATIDLRMLLWQTSGLHDSTERDEHEWPKSGSVPPEMLFEMLAGDTPDFEPGTAYGYSNVNYIALAYIAAIVSGMPYGDFLKSRIFEPLGMERSLQGYEAQQKLDLALPYETHAFVPVNAPYTLDLLYGAGDIVSTAHDIALWNISFFEQRLLKANSLAMMWSPGRLTDGTTVPYAMGWVPSQRDGARELWHNGYSLKSGGYCYNEISPDSHDAVTVLTNLDVNTARPFISTLHAHAR